MMRGALVLCSLSSGLALVSKIPSGSIALDSKTPPVGGSSQNTGGGLFGGGLFGKSQSQSQSSAGGSLGGESLGHGLPHGYQGPNKDLNIAGAIAGIAKDPDSMESAVTKKMLTDKMTGGSSQNTGGGWFSGLFGKSQSQSPVGGGSQNTGGGLFGQKSDGGSLGGESLGHGLPHGYQGPNKDLNIAAAIAGIAKEPTSVESAVTKKMLTDKMTGPEPPKDLPYGYQGPGKGLDVGKAIAGIFQRPQTVEAQRTVKELQAQSGFPTPDPGMQAKQPQVDFKIPEDPVKGDGDSDKEDFGGGHGLPYGYQGPGKGINVAHAILGIFQDPNSVDSAVTKKHLADKMQKYEPPRDLPYGYQGPGKDLDVGKALAGIAVRPNTFEAGQTVKGLQAQAAKGFGIPEQSQLPAAPQPKKHSPVLQPGEDFNTQAMKPFNPAQFDPFEGGPYEGKTVWR